MLIKEKLPIFYKTIDDLAIGAFSNQNLYYIDIISAKQSVPYKKEAVDFDNKRIQINKNDEPYSFMVSLMSKLCLICIKADKNSTTLDYFKVGYDLQQSLQLYAQENVNALVRAAKLLFAYVRDNKDEIMLFSKVDNNLSDDMASSFYQNMVDGLEKSIDKEFYEPYLAAYPTIYFSYYQNIYDIAKTITPSKEILAQSLPQNDSYEAECIGAGSALELATLDGPKN